MQIFPCLLSRRHPWIDLNYFNHYERHAFFKEFLKCEFLALSTTYVRNGESIVESQVAEIPWNSFVH